jgi:hypothetical protein
MVPSSGEGLKTPKPLSPLERAKWTSDCDWQVLKYATEEM